MVCWPSRNPKTARLTAPPRHKVCREKAVAALPPSLAESLWLSGGAFFELFEALPRRYPEAEPQIKTKPLGKP